MSEVQIILPPGVTLDESRDNIWGVRDSVKQRFPGFEGSILWQICQKWYVKSNNSTRPLLADPHAPVGPDNPELLVRSPINCRDEESSRDEYADLILQVGMNWDARSKLCTIEIDSPPHPEFRQVLAACHCVESVYQCHKKFPHHPQVRLAMQTGALHAVDLVAGAPEDTIRFLFVLCVCVCSVCLSCHAYILILFDLILI